MVAWYASSADKWSKHRFTVEMGMVRKYVIKSHGMQAIPLESSKVMKLSDTAKAGDLAALRQLDQLCKYQLSLKYAVNSVYDGQYVHSWNIFNSLKKFETNISALFRVDWDPDHLFECGAKDQKHKTEDGLIVLIIVLISKAVYGKLKHSQARSNLQSKMEKLDLSLVCFVQHLRILFISFVVK